MGFVDVLYGGVVDNYVVVFKYGVLFGEILECVVEEIIGKFYDVGFVYVGNFFVVVGKGEVESEFGDVFRFGVGDNFEGFDDIGYVLVFEIVVFVFGIFMDDGEVNVVVVGFEVGDVFD